MKRFNDFKNNIVLFVFFAFIIVGGNRITFADFTFGNLKNLGPSINTQGIDAGPMASVDDLSLFFGRYTSVSPYPYDMFLVTRPSKQDPWGTPISLGGMGWGLQTF
jgi:hypothetical protein